MIATRVEEGRRLERVQILWEKDAKCHALLCVLWRAIPSIPSIPSTSSPESLPSFLPPNCLALRTWIDPNLGILFCFALRCEGVDEEFDGSMCK